MIIITTSKTRIFCGNYGSGKTEIALNSAEKDGILIDIDVVNPYFTSSEHKAVLEEKGVRLISPVFAGTNVDIPVLPAFITGAFKNFQGNIVIDAGGTDVGATALGQYYHDITERGYSMSLVVNALRPFSSSTDEIIELKNRMEEKSRLKFTGIINNTNLQLETTIENILIGMNICRSVSQRTGLPIEAVYVLPSLIDKLPDEFSDLARPLTLYTRPEWL